MAKNGRFLLKNDVLLNISISFKKVFNRGSAHNSVEIYKVPGFDYGIGFWDRKNALERASILLDF